MDERVTVDQIVDGLRDEPERRPDQPGKARTWEDLHRQLHDEDLPALDQAGLITFDTDRGVVIRHTASESQYTARDRKVKPKGRGQPDIRGASAVEVERVFLLLAIISVGSLITTSLELGPLATLSTATVSSVLLVAFVIISIISAVFQ
ncbi:hypothetical protein [Halobellus captivus]